MSRTVLLPVDAVEQARRALERGPMAISSLGITAMAMFIEQQLASEALPPLEVVRLQLQCVLDAHAELKALREVHQTGLVARCKAELQLTAALEALASAIAATPSTPLEQEFSDAGER